MAEVKMVPARKRSRSRGMLAPRVLFKKPRFVARSPAIQKGPKVERKWVDTFTSTPFNTGNNFTLINGLAKGTDVYNRVGRRINVVRINVRGFINQFQSGAAPAADYLRLLVVYDREPNGSTPVLSDIIANVDNTGAVTTVAAAQLNLNNSDRFAILKEEVRMVAVGGGVASNQPSQTSGDYGSNFSFKWSKKVNLDVRYNAGNAGTVADITTGAIYVITMGDQAAANAQYQATFTTRIRFIDS